MFAAGTFLFGPDRWWMPQESDACSGPSLGVLGSMLRDGKIDVAVAEPDAVVAGVLGCRYSSCRPKCFL